MTDDSDRHVAKLIKPLACGVVVRLRDEIHLLTCGHDISLHRVPLVDAIFSAAFTIDSVESSGMIKHT